MLDFTTTQIIWENIEFIIMMLGVLAWLATGWLFWDGFMLNKKQFSLIYKAVGMFLMGVGNVVYVWGLNRDSNWHTIFYTCGLLMVGWGFAREPVLKTPDEMKNKIPKNSSDLNSNQRRLNMLLLPVFTFSFIALVIIMSFINSLILWVKVKQGLDKQFKLLVFVFIAYALAEMTNISKLFSSSHWPYWALMLEGFSVLSIFRLVMYAISYILLIMWVWKFIKFRIAPQLFLIMASSVMVVFVIMTGLLTNMSLNRIKEDAIKSMTDNNRVLQYAIESKSELVISHGLYIASDIDTTNYMLAGNSKKLFEIGKVFLGEMGLSRLRFIDVNGFVIVRADDQEFSGDFVGNNLLYKRAREGYVISSRYVQKDGINPTLSIQAYVPVKSDDKILGVVAVEFLIDEALIDSFKTITGLNTAIYANDVMVATTLWERDERVNMIGQTMKDVKMKRIILEEGDVFTGDIVINNSSYLVSGTPVISYDQEVIGALVVARPEYEFWSNIREFYRMIFLTIIVLFIILLPVIRKVSMKMEEYLVV